MKAVELNKQKDDGASDQTWDKQQRITRISSDPCDALQIHKTQSIQQMN